MASVYFHAISERQLTQSISDLAALACYAALSSAMEPGLVAVAHH
jgi:hypothetical protein